MAIINNLFDLIPEAKAYYNFEKNKGIDTSTLGVASQIKVWWKCPDCGAETYQSVSAKTRKLFDGSYHFAVCRHHSKNVLFDLLPKAKAHYNYGKNMGIDASSLTVASTKKVWWKCPDCGAETFQSVTAKVFKYPDGSYRFKDCQYCRRIKLFDVIPEASLFYNYEKNKEIDANTLGAFSHRKVWWKCPVCGDETFQSASEKVVKSSDGSYRFKECQYCRRNILFDLVPEAKDYYNYDKNTGVDVSTLTVASTKEVWWRCPNCGTETQQKINSKVRKLPDGSYRFLGCQQCSGNYLFDLIPEAKTHYNFDKNKGIDASSLTVASGKQVWWKCPECGAETQQAINSKVRKLSDGSYRFFSCQQCNRNFLFGLVPEAKAHYNFEKNKGIDADTLDVRSNRKVWWKCPACGDETFRSVCDKVYKSSDGSYRFIGCKYHYKPKRKNKCAQQTVSDTEYLARIWDYSNNPALDPEGLFTNAVVRANWVCPKCGYKWCAPVDRVNSSSGRCPACESRNVIVPGITDVLSLCKDARQYYAWDKNTEIDIEHLGVSSGAAVWWRCPNCGNESKVKICAKIMKNPDGSYRVRGCIKCRSKQSEKHVNENATVEHVSESQNVMEFWDWEGNKGIDPASLSITSKKTVSLKCQKCGYTWTTHICNLRHFKGECPHCGKSHVSECENLMKIWDWENNKGLDPANLSIFSRQTVSWKCHKCGYTWTSKIQSLRSSKGECPCCDKHRVIVLGVNDIFCLVPKAKEYYDFEKNADVDITTITITSKKRLWWKCPTCGNEIFTSPKAKIKKIDGAYHFSACKKCYRNDGNVREKNAIKEPSGIGEHSLLAKFPDIAQLWSANNVRSATTVTPDCTFSALWVCPDCKYEYPALVREMVNGTAPCPICRNKRIQVGYNTLADRNNDIAKLLSTNNQLRATDVFPTSQSELLWICPDCGGEYSAPVRDMVNGIAECPYCTDRRPLSGHNTLADKYSDLAAMWSEENDRGADSVLPKSAYEAKWDCQVCGGSFTAVVRDLVDGTAECPYCTGKKALPGFNSFAAKHPDLLKEWNNIHNYAIDIDPDAILDSNRNDAWWICEQGHKYKMSVSKRLMFEKRKKVACPICKGRRREVRHFI